MNSTGSAELLRPKEDSKKETTMPAPCHCFHSVQDNKALGNRCVVVLSAFPLFLFTYLMLVHPGSEELFQ